MVRPGFKQTEVGEIPVDWNVAEVESLISEISMGPFGSDIKVSNFVSHGVPVLSGFNVSNEKLTDGFTNFVTEEKARSLKKAVAKRGDVVVTHRGTIGQISYIPNDSEFEKYVISQSQFRAKFNSKVLSRWVTSYFLSESGSAKLLEGKGHTGVPAIAQATTTFRRLKVPLPSLVEQTLVTEALSDVDELIASLEKLIAKKRDIKTTTMQQLLTGKTRLPGFSGEWSQIRIETDANLKARIGWQALTTKEYLDSGSFYLVTGTDFVDGRVNWSTCHFVDEWRYSQDRNIQLKNGDVLLTKDGTIGKVGYVHHLELPATLNSGVFVIRPLNNKFDPLFLYYVLSSRIFEDFLAKITAGSTITHLYQKDFVTFEFLAPEVSEQKEIASVLDAMDAELAGYIKKLEKTKSIKQGMMQELLTGRTRLVESRVHQVEQERLHGT